MLKIFYYRNIFFCLLDIGLNNRCEILVDFELLRGKEIKIINVMFIFEFFG